MAQDKELEKYEKPEAYFDETVALLARLKDLVREEFPRNAAIIFNAYNKLAAAESAVIGDIKNDLKTDITSAKEALSSLIKETAKLKEPADAPFSLKVTIGAAKEKAKKHLFDSVKAADALLKYIDSADAAELSKAYELLSPMTV